MIARRMRNRILLCLILVCLGKVSEVEGFVSTYTRSTHGSLIRNPNLPQPFPRGAKRMHSKLTKPLDTKIRGSQSSLHLISATALASVVPLPVLTCLLPPCLGYINNEYTVSYGYGFATALTALVLWRNSAATSTSLGFLLPLHASALIFYGLRLNAFLWIRSTLSSRIKELIQRVEDRALSKGNRFATRTPFILSVALLYGGLSVPVWFTAKYLASSSVSVPTASWIKIAFQTLIGLQWLGFGIAALGDLTKTYVKQSEQDEKYLVTSGIFSMIRHPNYTGEILGWTANFGTGLLAAVLWGISGKATNLPWALALSNLGAMSVGWIGILAVLLRATSGLETRQAEMYGQSSDAATASKYKDWIKTTWGGWKLPAAAKDASGESHEIHLDTSLEEDSGSGI